MQVKEEELFYQLFETHPNISICHIENNAHDIHKLLESIVQNIGGSLKHKIFSEIDENRFRLTAREFEYVVISDCIHSLENIDKFIQECYHSLENSAQIIVLEKKDSIDSYSLVEILDRNDFRAVNQIELFEDYYLVVGKKCICGVMGYNI